jgi:hypothetical protein
MFKYLFRFMAMVVATTFVSSALVGCTTTNPHMRSDTGYGSTTIPTDHEEAVRQQQRERDNAKKHKKLTPDERRALVEFYKEVLDDI